MSWPASMSLSFTSNTSLRRWLIQCGPYLSQQVPAWVDDDILDIVGGDLINLGDVCQPKIDRELGGKNTVAALRTVQPSTKTENKNKMSELCWPALLSSNIRVLAVAVWVPVGVDTVSCCHQPLLINKSGSTEWFKLVTGIMTQILRQKHKQQSTWLFKTFASQVSKEAQSWCHSLFLTWNFLGPPLSMTRLLPSLLNLLDPSLVFMSRTAWYGASSAQ